MFDVAVTDNTATSGAGMRLVMGTLEIGIAITIWDSEIYANGATQGGGIYATGDEGDEVSLYPLVLENVEIAGNAAIEDGGGVWAEEVRVTTVGGAVRDNTAAQGGGVFLTTTGSLNCAETDFLGNEPEDVTIEGGVTYDAADTDATFSCNWTDPSCG